jgi:molybdopterin molybdotransferase
MTATRLLEIDDARAIVLEHARPIQPESLPVSAGALGLFLAGSIAAEVDVPPFANSSMDGVALRAQDAPGRLTIVGESAAGAPFMTGIDAGQAVMISTGAVLPDGADAVVPIERLTVDGDAVQIDHAVTVGEYVRPRGSDIATGAELVRGGSRVGPAQLGAALAAGIRSWPIRQVRAAVLTTGDELVSAEAPGPAPTLGPGQIYDSSGPMLLAALASARVPAVTRHLPDDAAAHRDALDWALDNFDLVISSGGVSVGTHDLVRGVAAELGVNELFWGIRMRPGKPLSFGIRDVGERRTLVFGLPGNPVSGLVTFHLFVRPAVLAMQGAPDPGPHFHAAPLAVAVRPDRDRDDLIRVQVKADGTLAPLGGQQSHQLAISALADGVARIPSGDGELASGTVVDYLPFDVC